MTVEDISIDGGRAPACHHQGTARSHSPQDPLRVVLSDSGSPHEEVEDKSNPKTKHSLSEVIQWPSGLCGVCCPPWFLVPRGIEQDDLKDLTTSAIPEFSD